MSNQQTAKLLRNVAAAYTIKDEKKFRFQIIAYQRAADVIENTPEELSNLYKEKRLDTLPGIGVSMRAHLEELFETGKVRHFEWVLKGIPESVFVLIDIPSFGPKKSYKLIKEFDLKNPATVIGNLILLAKSGQIAKVEGFGEKSEADILRSISEYKKGMGKIRRMVLPFAYEVAERILTYLRKSKFVLRAEPLGSLRRMKETVGDIDIAVATKNPKGVIDYFVRYPYKERVVEKGTATSTILVSGGKQIDLMTQPPERFGSLLQHFTGSKSHNIALREYALKHGLSISEYGIRNLAKRESEVKKYDTEEKFYNALGMSWIPPEMRENTGEIEHALKHNLPNLVNAASIKGDLHIHSSFPIESSHDLGKNSVEEMVRKAESLKYEYIGFSEHNPSVSKHTKNMIYSLIAKRNEHIEQLKSKTKHVRILKLLEIDILANGKLAIDDKSLAILDGALVSIHSSFNTDKKDMTKRVLSGLSHPKAKILSHPTGRMLSERPGYDLDFNQIFEFCKKNNKALEINAWPNRLDLPDTLIKEAVKAGVKLIIDTDSHALWQMDLMKYGVAMARRGWAKKYDIINTLGYEELKKWLKT